MRMIALATLLSWPALASFNGYTYERSITIDHTQVGASDSTDFPLLTLNGTLSYLATVANGGLVQNTSNITISADTGNRVYAVPDDAVFTSDSGCTTLLSWEIETYSATSGSIIAWVKIPTLSHTSDTVIYLCYGNSSVSTFQGGSRGSAWNANFSWVIHATDGSSYFGYDSTSNARTVTNTTTAPGPLAGQIDGSAHNTGASIEDLGANLKNNPVTYYAWMNDGNSCNCSIVNAVTNASPEFRVNTSQQLDLLSAGTALIGTSTGTFSLNTWTQVSVTYNGSGNYVFYINGAPAGSGTNLVAWSGAGNTTVLRGGTTVDGFQGSVDEIEQLNTVQTADWITARYNAEKTAANIVTIGTQISSSGYVKHKVAM